MTGFPMDAGVGGLLVHSTALNLKGPTQPISLGKVVHAAFGVEPFACTGISKFHTQFDTNTQILTIFI
jgi:hypothetical protein